MDSTTPTVWRSASLWLRNTTLSFSDLARYPDQFIFGAEYDFFEIHEGYEALCQYYDLKFKKTRDMDIGLKYEAIKSGKVDVMNIFTTDLTEWSQPHCIERR